MKFSEAALESAIIELLGVEGYPHVLGEALGERSSCCVVNFMAAVRATSLLGVRIKADLSNPDRNPLMLSGATIRNSRIVRIEGSRHHLVVPKFQTTASNGKSYNLPKVA